MTNDQDIRQFEGGTLGLVMTDEPPKENIWNASITRLRLGGLMLVFLTPLTEAAWFFDKVVPNHTDSIVYAVMEDACKEHGRNGHLEHKHIENMIAEMPEDEIEARVYGKALYLQGLIYKTYDPQVHVLKEPVRPRPGDPVWNVVDPHSDKPFASLWAFPRTNGDVVIFDEWPNEPFQKMHNCQLTIEDYKRLFMDKEQGVTLHRRVIDRHFADVRSSINKRTLREELRDIGMEYAQSYSATEEMETGILKVRSYLNYNTAMPITSINRPKLYINPHCENTKLAFSRWARDAKTGKVKDDYKDFMDCVRMLLMDDPKIDAPIPEQKFKKMWG